MSPGRLCLGQIWAVLEEASGGWLPYCTSLSIKDIVVSGVRKEKGLNYCC